MFCLVVDWSSGWIDIVVLFVCVVVSYGEGVSVG